MIAMDDVSIEIPDCDLASNALAQVEHWLGSNGRSKLELRHLKVRLDSCPTNFLESGRALITAAGPWQLSEGVHLSSGTNQWSAAQATLQPSGPHAGQLTLNLDPALTTNFFLFTSATTHKERLQ